MRFRKLKEQVEVLLQRPDFPHPLDEIGQYPPRQVVNPLFSFFLHPDELIRWRSVSAMGQVISTQYEEGRKEAARIIMRRLLWSLNDESGGIGWGAPEALGDSMARSMGLADEYAGILVSYILPHGNYLEHPVLQRGVLWGIARLAHAFPGYVEPSICYLIPYLTSEDPHHRGLASWTAGLYDHPELNACLLQNRDDPSVFMLYQNGRLHPVTVSSMASQKNRP